MFMIYVGTIYVFFYVLQEMEDSHISRSGFGGLAWLSVSIRPAFICLNVSMPVQKFSGFIAVLCLDLKLNLKF